MDLRDHRLGIPRDFFWFRGKRRLIDALFARIAGNGDNTILNVGAGVGEDITVIRRFGRTWVLDIEADALALIPDSLVEGKVRGDICLMPFADASFQVVLAFDTLEHIEDDHEAVREIMRVLRPGGHFLFTVPAFNYLWSAHDRALGHFRRYDKRMLGKLLGMFERIDEGYWTSSLFLPLAIERMLNRSRQDDVLRYVRLPLWVDHLFYWLLAAEARWIGRGHHLPLGTTIYGIRRKTSDQGARSDP